MIPHRIVEVLGITGFIGLELLIGARAWPVLRSDHNALWAAAAVLGGFVAADFVSGLIHWGFDRYGTSSTPVLGANFIVPFREHHVDPKGITRHDFVETNGNNCIATMPVLLPIAALDPAAGLPWLLLQLVLASMCLFVMGTNQFHKWAHQDQPPLLVVALMKAHLILETKHHDKHHTPPFDRYYCITSGWLNPLLDKVQFFKRFEQLIEKTTGTRAGEDDAKVVAEVG